jgi:manganese/zinc/iron transport system permease protein
VDLIAVLGDFTVRSVALGAALVGIVAGVLGCFAVLRQQSLLGDALSHAALPGICIGFLLAGSRQLGPILTGALVSGALAALLVLLLTRTTRIKTDAALGVSLSLFFAVGTVLLTYVQRQAGAAQAGLDAFLFGQAAAVLPSDLRLLVVVGGLTLMVVALSWKELKVTTFDADFARSLGRPVVAIEFGLTVLIAVAVVIGLQLVGVILMVALVIAPAAAARQWTRRLEGMVVLAAVFGAVSGVVGAVISATVRGLATGPVIVLVASALVVVSLLLAPERGVVWLLVRSALHRRSLRAHQVLVDLYRLGQDHRDAAYASEQGMLDAYFGGRTDHVLRRLERRGLVERVRHMPEEGAHWVLTDGGRRQARELLVPFGERDDGLAGGGAA